MAPTHRPTPESGTGDTVVVITGAAGNLGRKLCSYLRERGGYDLRLIDMDPRGDAEVVQADLSRYDESWTRMLDGADIVVHMAGQGLVTSRWDALVGPNVDALLNVFLAAARHRVSKIVLASSMWAVAVRWRDRPPIAAQEPDPGSNAYGATKLFAERVARAFAATHGIDTIALRVGACHAGPNPSDRTTPPESDLWLSNRDMCRGFEAAMQSKVHGFAVLNLTSANAGQHWSLAEARDLIGYVPVDHYIRGRTAAALSPRIWFRGSRLRLRAAWRAWHQPY